jgi:hypothetical protein
MEIHVKVVALLFYGYRSLVMLQIPNYAQESLPLSHLKNPPSMLPHQQGRKTLVISPCVMVNNLNNLNLFVGVD